MNDSASLCETVTGHDDGRTCWPRAMTLSPPPTWSSSASTACVGCRRRRRARWPPSPGHRHVPCRRGKAVASTAAEEARRGAVATPGASTVGADYVDVEWRAGFADLVIERDPARVVLSSHDFGGVPVGPSRTGRGRCAQTGAGVIKMAVTRRGGWVRQLLRCCSIIGARWRCRRHRHGRCGFSVAGAGRRGSGRAGRTRATPWRRDRFRRPGCSRSSTFDPPVPAPRSTASSATT